MSVKFGILNLIRVYLGIVALVAAYIIPKYFNFPHLQEDLFLVTWITAGFSVAGKCFINILKRDFFDENLLMTVATVGAICLGDYREAAIVMVLYSIGEYLQDRAVDNSKKSIKNLVNLRPVYASVERNGKVEKVQPEEIKVGEIVVVNPGELIPIDGYIVSGSSFLNVTSITGESISRNYGVNDYVLSGCISLNGVLRIKTDKSYSESTSSKFMLLIDKAREKKSHTEKLMTRFAKIYTPIVLIMAVLIVVIPLAVHMYTSGITDVLLYIRSYIERALIFLVISCPCAFVISVPLTFFSGIGISSTFGILIKGENYIEALAKVNTAVFDKTGTLTSGNPKVVRVVLERGVLREDFREAVLLVEANSNHPIALAIKRAFEYKEENRLINQDDEVKEFPGKGIWFKRGATEIVIGNREFMSEQEVKTVRKCGVAGTLVYVAKDKKYIGCIAIMDEMKQSAKMVISQLKGINIQPVMLTGDSKDNAAVTAQFLGIDYWYYGLVPEFKVQRLEELINKNKKGKKVLYAGDGINDAPVIMRADVGVAMGAIGSDAAIEAADVVIVDDNLTKIFLAINIARKTMRIAIQNIVLAIGVKVIFLILGAMGYMTMWGAIFADTGVTLITILNSLRILSVFDIELD